ncbi:SanA/YdcF family protein [Fundicoccus culcitae]|uniref:YdcF family protein n=1 Tax=Fundicoccus culcitae TaxID=2969821 RepID=A0ABY5P2L7_9LACT|nr:ElyC/SanA/YdcF family protein [Fundicoccus culcitae]UUX32963.1 YdcF family protein [Fundicoccus culcitae]
MRRIFRVVWLMLIAAIKLVLLGVVLFIVVIAGINLFVIGSNYSNFYTVNELSETAMMADDVPILVLGAGIINNEEPSNILANRLDKAIEIYEAAPNKQIIVSGDHTDQYYNEVAVMQQYLIEQGVNEANIVLDPQGYSTYESVNRLSQVVKTDKVIICTQGYHLSRALMIANRLGLEAVGVPADEVDYGRIERESREVFARVKDFAVVYFDYRTPFD